MKLLAAPVLSREELWPGGCLIWLQAPDVAKSAWPGQFLMVRCGGGALLRRPLGIHRWTGDGRVALLFSVVGRGTEWLAGRQPGEEIDLLGPLGNGFRVDDATRNLLLVAGGMGVAPLVALADWSVASGRRATLLMGCTTAPNVYPISLLPDGLEVAISTEDCSMGEGGLVTDLLPRYARDADQVFACGPLPMYRAMADRRDLLADRPTQVLLETLLGCGVGACLGCSIDTASGPRLVCKDGPVFDLDEVDWDKMTAPPGGRRWFML